jgi:hypothetical protein
MMPAPAPADGTGTAPVPLALRLRYHAQRLGVAGWSGIAAAAAAFALLLFTEVNTRPALERERVHAAQEALAEQRQRLRPAAAAADGPAEFVARLPAPSALPEVIEFLHDQAARRGLQIERGDYRLSREIGGLAQRHQVTLPIRGDYLRLQGWLRQALAKHPFLAIDDLSVRRAADDASLIESRVQLSIYTRNAP